MAQGTIEHSELPDELLHEPKGASTAAAGTVYIADGTGSGSFKKLPTSSLDITKPTISSAVHTNISETIDLNGSTLSQAAYGVLADIPSLTGVPQTLTTKINENAAELFRLYNNQKEINQQVSASLTKLETTLNQVIAALKGVGVFQ